MQNESHVRGGAETRRGKGRDFSLVPLSSDMRTYSGEVASPAVMGDLRLPSVCWVPWCVPVCPHPHSVSHCHLSAGPVLTCLSGRSARSVLQPRASTRELHSTHWRILICLSSVWGRTPASIRLGQRDNRLYIHH